MLDKEIFECCRKLRLSRNLAELAQTTEGSSHQEYLHQLLSDELRYREPGPAPKSWLPAPVSMGFTPLKDIALMKSPCLL